MATTQHESGMLEASEAENLAQMVSVAAGAIVSRVLAKNPAGTVTLFAFDAGQGLSEHSAPFDALVQVIEGDLDLVIGGHDVNVGSGEIVLMPANIPHALTAPNPAKMLLTMLRG